MATQTEPRLPLNRDRILQAALELADEGGIESLTMRKLGLALVLAILGRHGHVRTGGSDVFVNVVGGVRVDEPGCDLAVALAVASASRGVALRGTPRACFGELGLTGELRWVGHPERRLAEAAKHGLQGVIAPAGSGGGACEVGTLREALKAALPAGERDRRPLTVIG